MTATASHPASVVAALPWSARVDRLKAATMAEERVVSLDQARIITASYATSEGQPRIVRRAQAFAAACGLLPIRVDSDELVVGNRTPEVRAGVVFPEASVAWIDRELDNLPTRPQDPFAVPDGLAGVFRSEILPQWQGRTLEDAIYSRYDDGIRTAAKVVKINQRDHAQGHIIPDLQRWLTLGPAGLQTRAEAGTSDLHRAAATCLAGARTFIRRYAECADYQGQNTVATVCSRLAEEPPETFHEAVQATWFLFVLLHLESNASSFSPGRLDQAWWPYFQQDLAAGRLDHAAALELIGCLFVKCNQIVYLRNRHSAEFFAGFPIGFNCCIGGIDADGADATNDLTWLFLRAQSELLLPQPNLSLRVHHDSPRALLVEAARVIGRGSGMPQVFNDEVIVPGLESRGIARNHARDYAVVGCVELSLQGNSLGWSDAAMFNAVKALELALNDGVCLQTGERLGPATGSLADHTDYAAVEAALAAQLDHFVPEMFRACRLVEEAHAEIMPSPFLSSVVDGCLETGVDVTAGGARYNLSGIQLIQAANLADCLAVLKQAVYDEGSIDRAELQTALRSDWREHESLRHFVINRIPKYGNDVGWVDDLARQWCEDFAARLAAVPNPRGGAHLMGLYTVSAHVPMGAACGASADGRRAGEPLADGGVSPMYGRDRKGPTAVLKSVSRLPFAEATNGTLLNLKFLPALFASDTGLERFADLLVAWCRLGISHAQFNVVNREDLLTAQEQPEKWRHLTIRVAGYTAYFTELHRALQDEIVARTWM